MGYSEARMMGKTFVPPPWFPPISVRRNASNVARLKRVNWMTPWHPSVVLLSRIVNYRTAAAPYVPRNVMSFRSFP